MGFKSKKIYSFLCLVAWGVFAFAETVPDCGTLISRSKPRSLEEVLYALHGGTPLDPSESSRIGRYLVQTQAAWTTKRFKKKKGGTLGPEKLVIAIGPKSFKTAFRLFGKTFANGLEHLHTPGQGTLLTRWMTQTFSYAQPRGEWRLPTKGSIGPLIVLSDTEALRLQDFWQLNRAGWNLARAPWDIPEYGFPRDAYGGNCTAWFGHIPLGDETSEKLLAAGSVDAWGDRQGRGVRRGTLRGYPLPVLPVGQEHDGDLLRRVWSTPLHTRLWDLLEIPYQEATHTNPGWVALSLTARTSIDRVPVVFYYTDDHRKLPFPLRTSIEPVGD